MEKNLKISKIKLQALEEFSNIIQTLITKIGYVEVIGDEGFIRAKLNNPLNKEEHGFILIQNKLSGVDVDIDDIVNIIKKLKDGYSLQTLFIVSREYISEGFKTNLKNKVESIALQFLDRDRVIELIDTHQVDYWYHGDLQLLAYEKNYCEGIMKDNQLKNLSIFNDKYSKVLDLFVEPRIYQLYEDEETKTPVRKKETIEHLAIHKNPVLISGDAGAGKSIILKKLGELQINQNQENSLKSIPIFLTITEIFESGYDVPLLLRNKLSIDFKQIKDDFFESYKVSLFIDTIDELDEENQKKIIAQLNDLHIGKKINYYIGTRNSEKISSLNREIEFDSFHIDKFNLEQIKQFVYKFFPNHDVRAEKLLEALRDNRVIEKIPLTPLTLSLISILFEENNLEIPATITDIFDNFNSLLIGKATVSSKVQFIDISFKERILSIYALELLKRKEHTPMTKSDFVLYFRNYYDSKTIPIKLGSLEEALEYLINNTGIIILKNNKYVQFSHDSFMEYYSAIEIFKHQRSLESSLIENFTENNWQNAAIFYAGKSKDMPDFLEKISKRVQQVSILSELLSAVLGLGYLLQALYQTDNKLRKVTVQISLDLNIKIHELFSKLSSEEMFLFKKFKMPLLWVINMIYFYENFNSITLREPLKLAFDEAYTEYLSSKNETVLGYKALNLAITLNSKRINESNELQKLIFQSGLTNDVILCLLADFSLELTNGANYDLFKRELKKEMKKLAGPIKQVSELAVGKLRFSQMDSIRLNKKIKLVVEGKTDAEILEHAFMVLTEGQNPYWEIKVAGNQSGGAAILSKLLCSANPIVNDDDVLIGLFDHDAKGLSEFRGLKDSFDLLIKDTLKKHSTNQIYALCLPVPGELAHYLIREQELNFFEIEHYFDQQFLEQSNVVEKTAIPNVFKINDRRKVDFMKTIKKQNDPSFFKHFTTLFKQIDDLSHMEIHYID